MQNISLINSGTVFEDAALQLFHIQYAGNELYRNYCDALRIEVNAVKTITQIPFLPISFFKSKVIKTGEWDKAEIIFESSGTTGDTPSKHFVKDSSLYRKSLLAGFKQFYGNPKEYAILALLPSYLERKNASLVYMAQTLMEVSGHTANSFYLHDWDILKHVLETLEVQGQKTLLIGVTFALLDFAEACPMPLQHTIIMETGGMKGRKVEMTRTQVHTLLKQQFCLPEIHAEYGMTELLSQAYSRHNGVFECTDTMRVMVREMNDPLTVNSTGTGCLNIIDLANIHTCSFIATEDVGEVFADGKFLVSGRMDNTALRGCSLMVSG